MFLKRAFRFGLAIIAVWAAWLGAWVLITANQSDPGPADAAVVLGASVYGERPSPVFAERLNHAIELYQSGTVGALVFTGGLSQGDDLAEAEAGRDYALAHGVPAEDIFIETVSTTTFENLVQAQIILQAEGFERVLLVSDPLHMRRALTMARDLGLDAYPSPTTTSRYRSLRTQLPFFLREVYFYGSYLLVGEG